MKHVQVKQMRTGEKECVWARTNVCRGEHVQIEQAEMSANNQN